ncbi:hypothetical protein BDV96DRAFT_604331 [Lophiotrema nucula]|uniref:Uncharacterized protein n=1 Tax=Lophiotrema nucula TaxID=690887 RepID=A0A6A5YUT4_9PLEO|nr:hypothetical protein BDV96DRAFT_604331 [Lophiotrema nucula]
MPIQSLPLEMTTKVVSHLADYDGDSGYLTKASLVDIKSARLVSRWFNKASIPALVDACFVFYPTRNSMSRLLWLSSNPDLVPYVHRLKLVGVTLRDPSPGDGYLWFEAEEIHGLNWQQSAQDRQCLKAVTVLHSAARALEGSYTTLGQFRTDLTMALRNLRRLEMIRLDRDLAPGQHLPDWSGPDKLRRLTGWHDSIDLRDIFYGDYVYSDATGRKYQFLDDVFAAVQAGVGGRRMKVVVSSIPGRPFPLRTAMRGVADVDVAWKQDVDVEEERTRPMLPRS